MSCESVMEQRQKCGKQLGSPGKTKNGLIICWIETIFLPSNQRDSLGGPRCRDWCVSKTVIFTLGLYHLVKGKDAYTKQLMD